MRSRSKQGGFHLARKQSRPLGSRVGNLTTRPAKKDEAREYRISMEAVVDAYGPSEQAMGWYYYLKDKLNVPFAARCTSVRPISPLKVGEKVQVLGMAPEEECETEMFVWVKRSGDRIAVPLMQLQPISEDHETREVVGDWHYWVARGYEF
jgi:hypothetical protein